ncbi:hypothetical protein [Paenibacillus polymyxa]|uniref:hypothetical protein n=1 Tax=Paenibacillus polymyxa TaxID=1406 RepID=UPI002AB40549|nr:hypothetical protein [Paenibacillus polymyxa]MDY8021252.1 hypothetical protein [Paenibacillus polymyxa]
MTIEKEDEDFKVVFASKKDDDTIIVTSQKQGHLWLEQAMYQFDNNFNQYSSYLNESSMSRTVFTTEELELLADNAQNDIDKINKINSIVRYFINKDDLIGKVYETIESNVNTEYRLSFPEVGTNKVQDISDESRELINNFNKQINIKQLMRKVIPMSFSEGNYPMYLRKKGDSYIVDYYPLGVIEVSDYEIDGEPYLLINVNELKSRLKKTNKKAKNLFFDTIDEEIKNNYPSEIYEAYTKKKPYAKLNIKNSGIVRLNNLNRKYGLTSIFRALKPSLMLETFERTDRINAKAKAKKIIFQKLHKEILGEKFDKQAFEEMAYAHTNLMNAWKNETVVYTGAAFVEDVKYVEPKTENVNIENVNYQRQKQMTALGISFLNLVSGQSFTASNISVNELMKTINKISEQLEDILEKWYKVVLENHGISLEYCPSIKIIGSEELDKELKLKLSELLYSKLNASYSTVYGLLGIDIEDEKQKRLKENEQKYDEIFTPRLTAYTNSGDSAGGRPVDNNNPDKQLQDQDRRKKE